MYIFADAEIHMNNEQTGFVCIHLHVCLHEHIHKHSDKKNYNLHLTICCLHTHTQKKEEIH